MGERESKGIKERWIISMCGLKIECEREQKCDSGKKEEKSNGHHYCKRRTKRKQGHTPCG